MSQVEESYGGLLATINFVINFLLFKWLCSNLSVAKFWVPTLLMNIQVFCKKRVCRLVEGAFGGSKPLLNVIKYFSLYTASYRWILEFEDTSI
jgi:hypothetical protein